MHTSRWREFAFAFRQVLQAIRPWLPLKQMLKHWEGISAGLAEPPRRRKSQEELLLEAEEILI